MPRKSRRAAPGTVSAVHVAPPSTVRNTRPELQPAQATRALTAETLRQLAVDATDWRIQRAGPPRSASGLPVLEADRVAPEHAATTSTAIGVARSHRTVMRCNLHRPCRYRRCRIA